MSAIAGVVRWDGRPVARDELECMTERLRHRGLDGGGVWADGSVGFGHRMLHTTPESLVEQQPLHWSAAGLTITADARIDNRDELIAHLGFRASQSQPTTDSQLILAAYAKWGVKCASSLIGDFAFAIWDSRERCLFCARDPMGVKPFYYYQNDRDFLFASEIKALWTVDGPVRRVNDEHVANFLEGLFDDRESTFFVGVLRLPAAHTLCVEGGRALRLQRYWRLDAERELTLGSDGEYVEAFREAFDTAVRCRVRSAFPVGSALSGGLDSSSIAVTAREFVREHCGEELHTYSAIFPGMSEDERRICDESEFIDAVLETGGFNAHKVHADEFTPFHDMDRVLWHVDEPHFGYNLYIHWAMYDASNKDGVRVFLDGMDGDACISHGWEHLSDLVARECWDEFDCQIRALVETHDARRLGQAFWVRRFALPHLDSLARDRRWTHWNAARQVLQERYGFSKRALLLSHALRPLVPNLLKLQWRRLRGRMLDIDVLATSLTRNVRRRVRSENKDMNWPTCRAAHRCWIENPLYQIALEIADKCAAHFRIEPRYPFFDRRLMELCVSLPADQKLAAGWTRAILRRGMTGRLPSLVQWRPFKNDLGPNFRRGVRDHAHRLLASGNSFTSADSTRFIDPVKAHSLAHRFAPHWQRLAMTDTARALYRIAVLRSWLESHSGAGSARLLEKSRSRSAPRSESHSFSTVGGDAQ